MVPHSQTSRVTLALPKPIPGAGVAMGLFTKAMQTMAQHDRGTGTHRSVLFITPDSECWEPLLEGARKSRDLKLAREIIPIAIEAYTKARRKSGGPLRCKQKRDSMPLLVASQKRVALDTLKRLGYRGVTNLSIARGGTALNFTHQGIKGQVRIAEEKDLSMAITATPEGLDFVLEDGSGRTTIMHTPRKALLAPKFINQLACQIARYVRALVVHVDPKLDGAPAEILRQVFRKVSRQKAESAVACKKVGAVDRSNLLCPLTHRLVRQVGAECACGAIHSPGILDAYVILAAGKDSLGAVAYPKPGRATHQQSDVLTEGATFREAGDKDYDDDACANTAAPSRLANPGVCRDCEPFTQAVTVGRAAHTEWPSAQEPVGGSPDQGALRPVIQQTPDPTLQAVEPQPCSPAEASIEHPLLLTWWQRIDEPRKPKVIEKEDVSLMLRDAASAAHREARFYVENNLVHLIPNGCCLNSSSAASDPLQVIGMWLFQNILKQAASDFPALAAEI